MPVGFDLDGVLLDSESDLAWLDRALDAALSEVGLAVTEEHRKALYPGAISDFDAAASDLGLDPETLWEVRNRHYTREKVAAVESGEIGPFDDVDAVRAVGDERFLVSNSPQEVVDAFLDAADLADTFSVAVGRGPELADLDLLKPDLHSFERVSSALGEGEYVYVGDSATDREFAANAGMGYVHLDRDERTLREAVAAVESGRWKRR